MGSEVLFLIILALCLFTKGVLESREREFLLVLTLMFFY